MFIRVCLLYVIKHKAGELKNFKIKTKSKLYKKRNGAGMEAAKLTGAILNRVLLTQSAELLPTV